MNYIIGIDGGTTRIKAVLFDETGHEIEVVSAENDLCGQGGRRELNMHFFFEKIAACVKLLMDKGPAKPAEVLAIGLTGQGEGLWALDKKNEPIGNAILWNDNRAAEESFAVNEKTPGIGKLLHRNLGTPVGAGSALILLKWLKNNRPSEYRQIQTVFFAKDWLRFCLTGKISTDFTDGGASYLKLMEGVPAKQAFTVLGIPEVEAWIPEVLVSGAIAGVLTTEAAQKTGLSAGIPVVTGAMDVVTSAIGTGAVHSGDAVVVLGTTIAVERVLKRKACDVSRCYRHYLHHSINDLAIDLRSTINGMENVEWMLREVARSSNRGIVEGIIDGSKPGCGGVVYHPYLSPSGERAPFIDGNACASFFGLHSGTKKGELMRAVYEGVAYSIRDCLESNGTSGRLLLSGGGAASQLLCQLIADITSYSTVVTKGTECGALGAAMLAGTAIGHFSSLEEAASKCCRLKKIYQPHPNQVYDQCFQFYKELQGAFAPLWQKRVDIFSE